MSEEEKKEIEEQYKKGLVNLSNVIEPLINLFKTDYSLDIQQLRLVTNYLLLERDFNEDYYFNVDREVNNLRKTIAKQQKEIEELKEDNKHQWEERCKLTFELENSTSKDKIKAKIEEYDDKGMTVNLANRSAGKTFQQAVKYEVREILQSLLKEE